MQLNDKETALVLAGLRLLQRDMAHLCALPDAIEEILADGKVDVGQELGDIDRLCEKINTTDDSLLDTIAELRDCLANWVEIADDEDKRDCDDEALEKSAEILRQRGRTV